MDCMKCHTSLDKLGTVVTSNGLNKSFNLYKKCLESIEKNIIPLSLILCEPQMGKRKTLSKYIY